MYLFKYWRCEIHHEMNLFKLVYHHHVYTHYGERINVWLVSSLTRLDSTNQEDMLFFARCKAAGMKPVKLETRRTGFFSQWCLFYGKLFTKAAKVVPEWWLILSWIKFKRIILIKVLVGGFLVSKTEAIIRHRATPIRGLFSREISRSDIAK